MVMGDVGKLFRNERPENWFGCGPTCKAQSLRGGNQLSYFIMSLMYSAPQTI